jgi:hypothetical protein
MTVRAWCRQGVGGPLLAAIYLACLVAIIYVSDLGRGFIKDDFSWILSSRVTTPLDLGRLFAHADGFYRPIVSLTFAFDVLTHGMTPFGFGVTNFVLLLACTAGVGVVGIRLGMPRRAAVVAAALWVLNFHGINMAVLWISGRTALLVTLFSLSAAVALLTGHRMALFVLALAALFSKEEATLLPVMLTCWALCLAPGPGVPPRQRLRAALRQTWPCWAAAAIYLLLRAQTPAFLPWSSPPFYRFTMDPGLLSKNVLEYADRAATLSTAAVLLVMAVSWRVPRPSAASSRLLIAAALWVAGGFALTVLLPVRSSLYVCFPSVGVALAAAVLVEELLSQARPGVVRGVAALGVLVPVLLLPVYRARNERWVKEAYLSAQTLRGIAEHADAVRRAPMVVILDDRSVRPTLDSSFGTLLPTAVRLTVGHEVPLWIEPPPADAAEAGWVAPARLPDDVLVLRRTMTGLVVVGDRSALRRWPS